MHRSATLISPTDSSPPRPAGSLLLSAVAAHARARPGATALAAVGPDGGPTGIVTYCELAASAAALAGAIRGRVSPGETVLLAAPSTPGFVRWFCAAIGAGVRLLPVHTSSTGAELGALAERAGVRAVIAPAGSVAAEALGLPWLDFGLASEPPANGGGVPPTDTPGAVLLQSSGTTGLPKLALRESAALDADGANVAEAAQLTADDVVLAAMPLSHSYGVDTLLATLHAGAALHILETFDGAALADHLAHHASVFPGVPFAFEALARLAPVQPARRLRLAFAAGSPLPPRVQEGFRAAWGLEVGQLYGATELGSVTLNDPASPLYHPRSVGVPMTGVSIRVVDPDDPSTELPPGEEGHVAVAAPSMLSGYLDGAAETVDGHLLTGDLGRVDDAGRLFITGRLKLLIDIGGLKVNPLEVEAALALHPGVAECAVVAMPLSDTVNRLRAVVVPRDPASPPGAAGLRAFLKDRLSPHKLPRVFEMAGSLPRSATGKLLRQALSGARP